MKKLTLLLFVLLCFVYSCETDSNDTTIDSEVIPEPTYRYITDQQVTTTESFIIDFESFNAGDIVSEISITDPFENFGVNGITMAFPNSNAAMIFDSSNPTGGDFDLGTPNELYGGPGIGNGGASNDTALGNVLILSEDLDASDPDDIFEIGANFRFDFSANDAVTLNGFDILDIEDTANTTTVTLYDLDENILFTTDIAPGGDNSKTAVDLENTANVAFMEIVMNSSGAIDNIALELENEEPCDTCESSIASLSFKYIGFEPQATVLIQTVEGTILFNELVSSNDEFTITGASGGPIGSAIELFLDEEQIANLPTDCSLALGPGFYLNGLEIIGGVTETGGQLCPVEIFN